MTHDARYPSGSRRIHCGVRRLLRPLLYSEGLVNSLDYRRVVAEWYERSPVRVERDVQAWHSLAAQTLSLARRQSSWLTVVPVEAAEPYATVGDMFRDMGRGVLMVSDLNHDHPVWTPEVVRAFRTVHDVAHYVTGADFSWEGELRAYRYHDAMTDGIQARHALFTEAVGQVAYALEHGGTFGAQKAAILPQWLFWASDDVPTTREYQLVA